ncbi:MAG: ATP-binding protein [Defluviitaleaceae bacterium]|nr:ATP-binding protein [Defluviitaleaceae bacterium]
MPAYMLGDEIRIKQILNNVLSNAFKYTDKGSVSMYVHTEIDDRNPDRAILVITVSDTGQGMDKEQVDKLFEVYSRFNLEANRLTEGTGLGMSITRNLINLMEGSISVESEPGKGSIFTIRLPQGIEDSKQIGRKTAENLSKLHTTGLTQMKRVQITREPMPYGKVLIVDDVDMNIYVAKGLMTPYELQIDSAESGFAAIEMIEKGNEYDIVFMDHMMPQMDGIETTKRLRDMGYTRPIVALTANAVVGQSNLFLNNGFDDFISKPIDIRNLNVVLNRMIRDKQPTEVLEAVRLQSPEVIVDDDSYDEYMKSSGVYEMVYKDFSHSQKNVIPDIMDAIESNDFKTARFLVHTMKGLAGLVDEETLVDLAEEAEAAFRAEKIPSECMISLASEAERVLAMIAEKYGDDPSTGN